MLGPVWGCDRLVIRAKVIENQILAASAIAISSDSSDESVGSPPSQVILFGDIPTVIPSTSMVALETSIIAPVISYAAPVVETTLVASPTELCGLVSYLGSDSDSPDEMSSLEPDFPLLVLFISPFLCTDSSEAPDSSDGPPSQDPYVATIARWRSRVTTHPSSSSEFPIAPVTAPPGIRRWSAILIRPRRLFLLVNLTAPTLMGRFIFGFFASSFFSETFRHWCAAPLSTLYPPTTSESSSGDSSERPLHSSSHFAGPSRKRCRSPVDSVPSSMPVMGSLAPTRADLLPPRKRFRDSYSSEACIEEDAEEYEADTSARDTVEVGIDPMSAPIVNEEIVEPVGEDSSDLSGTRGGIFRSFKDMPIDLGDAMCNFYHYMSEVRIDRIVGIKTAQSRLEADQLIASGDRARMAERIYSLRLENLKVRAMLDIERDRMNNLRLHMSLLHEEFCQIRRDRDDARGKLRRTMTNTRSGMTPAAIEEMINQRVDAALEARRCINLVESNKRTIRTNAAYALSWRELLKRMTEVYCPRNEIQKMETELWNL
ncbi:hypothetical protein Tco_0706694 [Tanacetum coccineum]|uniref:Uncharacterized protein n=1 Tax=Tanacetum coccineum TaxID=301880 RepID=A0ABQ4Y9P4_9ASTR